MANKESSSPVAAATVSAAREGIVNLEDAGLELFDSGFLARLEKLSLQTSRLLKSRHMAERRARNRGTSMEFADYRNYVRGDDLRTIDWNIYGRLERLFIRLFESEEDLPVTILVDDSASMLWPGFKALERGGRLPRADFDQLKYVYACRVGACLAYIALGRMDRVRLGFFSGDLEELSGFRRGKLNFRAILSHLRDHRPASQATSLADTFRSLARVNKRAGLIIVLSDFMAEGTIDDLREAIRRLPWQRCDIVGIHLVHPEESRPGLSGSLQMRDVEGAGLINPTVTPEVVREYEQRFARYCLDLDEALRNVNGFYLRAETVQPFDELVLRSLRDLGLLR